MAWTLIRGEGVRNLRTFVVSPSAKINLIAGDNGAGKTSFLEALCVLGVGRSFRASSVPDGFVAEDSDTARVFGQWSVSGNEWRVGVERKRNAGFVCRVNNQTLESMGELSERMAVKVVSPDALSTVSGDGQQRRANLEWMMFHVEHRYRGMRQKFLRALRSRNLVLKDIRTRGWSPARRAEVQSWDRVFVQHAEALSSVLAEGVQTLEQAVAEISDQQWREIVGAGVIRVRFKRGWPEDTALLALLKQSIEKDVRRGFTFYGPQRFDFSLRAQGRALSERLSRGELKTIAVSLQIAQVAEVARRAKPVVVLIDDLFAELDARHADWCLRLLEATDAQVFVTGVTIPAQVRAQFGQNRNAWFHVEHGKISTNRATL